MLSSNIFDQIKSGIAIFAWRVIRNYAYIKHWLLSWYAIFIKVLGIEDVTEFEFMDPPSEEARDHALETLKELKALDSEGTNGIPYLYLILSKRIFELLFLGKITEHGRKMAEYPLDPSLANMLIQSSTLSCSKQILTIVAMLSTQQTLFSRPRDQLEEADKAKVGVILSWVFSFNLNLKLKL